MESEYTPHTPRLKMVDQYIRELFRDELPAGIKYHNADHTLHSTKGVVAVANNLAILEDISEQDRELLIAAAYFHDTGYIREYERNEPIAARMAGRILKLIGYKPDEIETVQKMILTTDPEVEPKTHAEKILCDADLDNLGREDFFQLDERLREGRRIRGIDVSDDATWYRNTFEFLEKHQYYTKSQKKLRQKGKEKNIKGLLNKLEDIEKNKHTRT
jgi:predicted metal-dependent HD superfamily phosphohydrolase